MPWLQLRLNSTAEEAEKIGDLMSACGALTVTFLDAKDNPVFEPLPGETRLWGETDVMGLWDAEADMDIVVSYLRMHGGLSENQRYKLEPLEDKDWEREWMDNFHPMQFGQRLWICPSWCEPPVADAVNVILDPGLAFGTGTHPTTALCLEWLDGLSLEGKTVVDFGCGSGILAVAALKLGAASVIGIDIDPQALQASRDNAQRNGVSDRLQLYLPEQQPEGLKADVVVANILAGPLKQLAPLISSLPKTGGNLALSGVLEPQANDVAAAYQSKINLDPICCKEEWARISGVKK